MLANFLLVLVLLALFALRIYVGFFRAVPDLRPEVRARLERQYRIG